MAVDTVVAERRVTWPDVTRAAELGSGLLQIGDIGVLERRSDRDHAGHIFPVICKVALREALSNQTV